MQCLLKQSLALVPPLSFRWATVPDVIPRYCISSSYLLLTKLTCFKVYLLLPWPFLLLFSFNFKYRFCISSSTGIYFPIQYATTATCTWYACGKGSEMLPPTHLNASSETFWSVLLYCDEKTLYKHQYIMCRSPMVHRLRNNKGTGWWPDSC